MRKMIAPSVMSLVALAGAAQAQQPAGQPQTLPAGAPAALANPPNGPSGPSGAAPANGAPSAAAHSGTAPTPRAGGTSAAIGVRVDCLHNFNRSKGAAQDCLSLSGLRYTQKLRVEDHVEARFRLDPFAVLPSNKARTPLRAGVPTIRDTDLVLVDDWALTWLPRPNLEVALENYEGVTRIPEVSGLALAGPYNDLGWRQMALTVTYNLAALPDMRVQFAAGNGEGETDENLDPQQYFGFEVSAAIVQGLRGMIGVSLDGNNVGSAEYTWLTQRYQDECGFDQAAASAKLGYSTQRLAAGIALDGTLPAARGIKLGLGWQRNISSDVDKATTAGPKVAELKGCKSIDLDTIFVEAANGDAVNTVQRTVYDISLAYEVWDGMQVGADYSTRRIDTGSVKLFETCSAWDGERCIAPTGSTSNQLAQDAITVGGTMRLAQDLDLTLEYNVSKYDKKYAQVFYADRDGKTSDTLELFNARVAYNWR